MEINLIDETILNKYKCRLNGLERIYSFSLEETDMNMWYTFPCYFCVGEFESYNNSWRDVLIEFVTYLSGKCNLLKFKPIWCSSFVFTSVERNKSNEIRIKEGLYFNFSYFNNHEYELIRDLIKFSSNDYVNIEYKRMPKVEPKEIRKEIIAYMKLYWREYLLGQNLNDEEVKERFSYIKTINNSLTELLSTGYDNIYLIDNKAVLYRIVYKYLDIINSKSMNTETKSNINKYLKEYCDFFVLFRKFLKTCLIFKCQN